MLLTMRRTRGPTLYKASRVPAQIGAGKARIAENGQGSGGFAAGIFADHRDDSRAQRRIAYWVASDKSSQRPCLFLPSKSGGYQSRPRPEGQARRSLASEGNNRRWSLDEATTEPQSRVSGAYWWPLLAFKGWTLCLRSRRSLNSIVDHVCQYLSYAEQARMVATQRSWSETCFA